MIRKYQIIFLLILFFYTESAKSNPDLANSLIGEWVSENEIKLKFIFSENEITIIIPTNNSNLILEGTYFSDSSRNINTIDIKSIENISYSLHGIYKLIGKNKIKISKFSKKNKTRPISFEKNNYYTLTKRNK